MRNKITCVYFAAATIIHIALVHAFLSFHANVCARLPLLNPPGSTRVLPHAGGDFIWRSFYYIMLEWDPFFLDKMQGALVVVDVNARMDALPLFRIGGVGFTLPLDATTLLTTAICVITVCVASLLFVFQQLSNNAWLRSSKNLLLASGVAAICSVATSGATILVILQTDIGAMWPMHEGPFLPMRSIVIATAIASGAFILTFVCIALHASLYNSLKSDLGCACGYDLTGIAGDVCPECGTARNRQVYSRTFFALRKTLKWRLPLWAMLLTCISTTGLLAWCFIPLRWQVYWPHACEYLTTGASIPCWDYPPGTEFPEGWDRNVSVYPPGWTTKGPGTR